MSRNSAIGVCLRFSTISPPSTPKNIPPQRPMPPSQMARTPHQCFGTSLQLVMSK